MSPRLPRRHAFPLLPSLLVLALSVPCAHASSRLIKPRGDQVLPLLVSIVHHHSTRGIWDNALPILAGTGGRGTLGLLVLEMEKTRIPPYEVSTADTPGGLGNVQPLSHGAPDQDGLYAGRLYAANPAGFMTDAQIRQVAAAGWELAFHGADHSPQTGILGQVDGAGKLRRAYAAGIDEIHRVLGDPTYPVRTNTLAHNAWSQEVRGVASELFQWTEVRWNGSQTHAPVAYANPVDRHGGFNSIDFSRLYFDGLQDLDELVRLAGTDGGGWLIIQVHDVVDDLAMSPDPPRAMRTSEYAYLIQALSAVGARFVTFSEAAAEVVRDNPGNRLRNTLFATHSLFPRPQGMPLDWFPASDALAGGTVTFPAPGVVQLTSSAPATLGLTQVISPALFREQAYVLRAGSDLLGMTGGALSLSLRGPLGERSATRDPDSGVWCVEINPAEIAAQGFKEGEVVLALRATGFTGAARFESFQLTPLRRRSQECRFASGQPR